MQWPGIALPETLGAGPAGLYLPGGGGDDGWVMMMDLPLPSSSFDLPHACLQPATSHPLPASDHSQPPGELCLPLAWP